jgi:hypothetical protein
VTDRRLRCDNRLNNDVFYGCLELLRVIALSFQIPVKPFEGPLVCVIIIVIAFDTVCLVFYKVLIVLVDGVVGQVHEEIFDVVFIRLYVGLSGKSG